MQLTLTDQQFNQMLALVELGEFALKAQHAVALVFPQSLVDKLHKMRDEGLSPQDAAERYKSTFNPETPDAGPDAMFAELVESPDGGSPIQNVLLAGNSGHYMKLFRDTSLLLANVTNRQRAEDLEEHEFNELVENNLDELLFVLRKHLLDVDTPEDLVTTVEMAQAAETLEERFKAGKAIDQLLKEI